MKKYIIRDREAGNVIDEFNTIEEAEKAMNEYIIEDCESNSFENWDENANFYEIVEVNND